MGNRMYRNLGHIKSNPWVGLLLLRFDGKLFDGAARLYVNGCTEIDESEEAFTEHPDAKSLVRVVAHHIFTNCPRYVQKMVFEERSVYIPARVTRHRTPLGNQSRLSRTSSRRSVSVKARCGLAASGRGRQRGRRDLRSRKRSGRQRGAGGTIYPSTTDDGSIRIRP